MVDLKRFALPPGIPRVLLGNYPTPLERLPRFAASLGGPKLWIKRDDISPLALGGNKTRKLEFLLGEALALGADTILTVGAPQSNHCRQTAAAAARSGLRCVLVLGGAGRGAYTANLLLDDMLGAEVHFATQESRDEKLAEVRRSLEADGRKVYFIPYGGASPVGEVGFVYAMAELQADFAEQDSQADWIVAASASGGMQAGLLVGARWVGYPGRILGISVEAKRDPLLRAILPLAEATAQRLGCAWTFGGSEVLVNDEYLGQGYGIPAKGDIEAMRLLASTEGIVTDPVYTGRALAGLVDLIRNGFFRPDESVLFWHTGGVPALYAYLEDLRSWGPIPWEAH